MKSLSPLKLSGGVTYKLSSEKDFSLMIGKRVLNAELKMEGIPVYSANVFEPLGFIDKNLITDFNTPSILWGIDGDWMVNTIPKNTVFYPTDHAGVLRVKNPNINYRYLAYKLEQEGIREGFSRSYRASIAQIKKLTVRIPGIDAQNKAIEKIESIEKLINLEKMNSQNILIKKENVIKKFLY